MERGSTWLVFFIKTNKILYDWSVYWVVPEKIHTPTRRLGFWKFSLEGGQRPWKPRWEQGLNSKKSSAGVISTNSSCDLNVSFGDTFALIYPENSRSILFTYISPDINDNLSSFAGPFIAENANKILKTVTTLLERRICHAWHIFTRTQTQPATVE